MGYYLWDIKGKLAGMPVYQLLGGRTRNGAKTFADAMGKVIAEVGDNAAVKISQGFSQIRLFLRGPDAGDVDESQKPENAPWGHYYDPKI